MHRITLFAARAAEAGEVAERVWTVMDGCGQFRWIVSLAIMYRLGGWKAGRMDGCG